MAELRQERACERQDAAGLLEKRKQVFPLRVEEGILLHMVQESGLKEDQEQESEQAREEDMSAGFQHRNAIPS
jgi:hypothetical protein